jgi:hypothetical protein
MHPVSHSYVGRDLFCPLIAATRFVVLRLALALYHGRKHGHFFVGFFGCQFCKKPVQHKLMERTLWRKESMAEQPSVDAMKRRIRELEDLLDQLRMGRRVLINLLEITQKEQKRKIEELEKENQRLKRKNKKYVEALIESKWRR